MNLFQEVQINTAFAFGSANFPAPALSQIPRFVATDVEKTARKVGQLFVVELVQKGQGAGMIRRERGWTPDKSAARVFVRTGNLGELLQ